MNKYRVDTQNCFLYSFLCSNQKKFDDCPLRNFSQLNDQSSIGNIVQPGMNFPSSPYLFFLTTMICERFAKYSAETQPGGISWSASLFSELKRKYTNLEQPSSCRSLFLEHLQDLIICLANKARIFLGCCIKLTFIYLFLFLFWGA